MKKFIVNTFFLFICIGVTQLHAQKWKAQAKNYIEDRKYDKALALLLEKSTRGSSLTDYTLRASVLARQGNYHLALAERTRAALSRKIKLRSTNLAAIGELSLITGALKPITLIANRLNRLRRTSNLPASYKIALAWSRLRKNQLDRARKGLPSLSQIMTIKSRSARSRALLIAGTILWAKGSRNNASSYFKEVVDMGDNALDKGLAQLQMARIFYESNNIEATSQYLGLISKRSPQWFEGLLVGSWGAYRAGDYNLALGQLMTLRSPYLVNKFNPEIHVLEAVTLYELCYFKSAKRSLDMLVKRYKGFDRSLRKFRRIYGRSTKGLKYALSYARGNKSGLSNYSKNHWALLMDGILNQDYMSLLDEGRVMIEKQRDFLGDFSKKIRINRYSARHLKFYRDFMSQSNTEYNRWGIELMSSALKRMESQVKKSLEQALTINLEIDYRIRDRITENKTARTKKVDYDSEIKRGYEFWPFEGEHWKDELGSYYFVTPSACEQGA